MTRWIMSACALALMATPVAAADVRLDNYRNPQNEYVDIKDCPVKGDTSKVPVTDE